MLNIIKDYVIGIFLFFNTKKLEYKFVFFIIILLITNIYYKYFLKHFFELVVLVLYTFWAKLSLEKYKS